MKFLPIFGRRGRRERELDEELRTHLAMAVRERIEQGEAPAEAEANARREFGNVPLVKEVTRDQWGGRWLETLLQDVRYGFRQLRRNPGFTAVAVLTLALGIGANTAIFSVFDSVLWKPLPLRDPGRLVYVSQKNLKQPGVWGIASIPNFMDWASHNRVFEQLAAYGYSEPSNLNAGGVSKRVRVRPVSANLFPALGIRIVLGRNFLTEEEQEGHDRVAILSSKLWHQEFASNPGVVHKTIKLAGEPHVVVGIVQNYESLAQADVFVPINLGSKLASERDKQILFAIGRLKLEVSLGQARANMETIGRRLAIQYPQANGNWGVRVEPLRLWMTAAIRPTLVFFLVASSLVLLVACADVASLLLVRATVRQTEFATRAALGGGRLRLIRQLLTESVMLALAGGSVGAAVAFAGVGLFRRILPPDYVPRMGEIGVDVRVLAFTLAVCLIATVLFGLAPALFASQVDLNTALKQGGRNPASGSGHRRLLSTLVTVEVALSMILLIGAGLFVNSLFRLRNVDPGFDTYNLMTARISLEGKKYFAPQKVALFYRQLLEDFRAYPGVESAVITSNLPLTGGSRILFAVEDGSGLAPNEELSAIHRIVTTGYFQAMKIPLLRGRGFAEQDNDASPRVAIINENLAQQYFPGENPIGRGLKILAVPHGEGIPLGTVRIVGVAANVKEVGLDEMPFQDVYLPFLQQPARSMYIAVRTFQPDPNVPASLRKIVLTIDRDQAADDVMPMAERVSETLGTNRFNMFLIGAFAAMALILSTAGIYGLMSYTVSRRKNEVGIRMALGARAEDVLRLIVYEGVKLTAAGLAVGVCASLILGKFLHDTLYMVPYRSLGFIYGVSTHDPMTLGCAALFVAGVAVLACYIPARRAASVDPMVALRYE